MELRGSATSDHVKGSGFNLEKRGGAYFKCHLWTAASMLSNTNSTHYSKMDIASCTLYEELPTFLSCMISFLLIANHTNFDRVHGCSFIAIALHQK